MTARVKTVAFQGVEIVDIDVQVQITGGFVAFNVVGLPDKAIAESRERVRAALHGLGLSLPAKRITVNLAPADLFKEGSHFDLPIALGILVAMDVLPNDAIENYYALGELALDGAISSITGVLPAAIHANARGMGLICAEENGTEAAWAGPEVDILAPSHLLSLINHFKGTQVLVRPEANMKALAKSNLNYLDIKGQESAKRAIEVVAAGGHNLLMIGPPGAGKSMMASRLPSILPPLTPHEALEVSMIHSIAGLLEGGHIVQERPFRDPHHSASMVALVGGGAKAKPGEISLAHKGVLFLDELPEFSRATLEALRQPLETGQITVSRANHHVTYPSDIQLIAAMNPCRCGHLSDASLACSRAPKCAGEYQSKISGPLFDRFDCHIDVPAVSASDLSLPDPKEDSSAIAARVALARARQQARYDGLGQNGKELLNSHIDGALLEKFAAPDPSGRTLLTEATEKLKLSARGYHRILRLARTLADLEGIDNITRMHIAEALSYRRIHPHLN